MKILVEISQEPKKDDILVHNGRCFTPVNKNIFLNSVALLEKRISELEEKNRKLKGQLLVDEGKITQEDFKNGNY